jgi:hypothetical protein
MHAGTQRPDGEGHSPDLTARDLSLTAPTAVADRGTTRGPQPRDRAPFHADWWTGMDTSGRRRERLLFRCY